MKEIKGSIDIEAPPDRVWGVLTDFSSYPRWNPWITKMWGELKVGNTYDAVVTPPGKGAMKLRSTVVRIDNGKQLLFKGKAMGGLVNDEHLFVLESAGPEMTRFHQSVIFKGILIPLLGGTIRAQQNGLQAMNVALKKICEKREIR